MTRPKLIALLFACAAVAAAGCGDDDDDTDRAPATPAETSGSGSAPPAATGPVTVSMKDLQFEPRDVAVKVGQKVTWRNDEPIDHNVVANSGADFESDNFGEGKSYEFTPDKAGKIEYECTLHPGMTGTVDVTAD